jgi:hypothetical protein
MRKTGVVILLLSIMTSGWTQNPNLDYKYAVKIYNLTSFEEYSKTKKPDETSASSYYTTTSMLQILQPAVAFQWKTSRNNFREIELTSFMSGQVRTKTELKNDTADISQTVGDNKVLSTSVSARYEYIVNFNKQKDKKLVPSVGFGVNPYYRQNKNLPGVSSSFSATEKYLGVRLFITPGLSYYLTSKLFLNINIPLCVGEIYYMVDKDENPLYSANQRTTSSVNFSEFPKIFCGRIGVGLKL